jgi:RNA polymerase sigma factor (sigma-70 family)
MSANDQLAHSDAWNGCPVDRWQRMWGHREQLLKVARRRSMSTEDAEDAVHEAMVRAAERTNVDDDRLGAWLTSVTMRLCVDRFRQVNREAEVHARSVQTDPGRVTVEEALCDQAEAKWLAARGGDLPARQAEALRLQTQGLDLTQIAQQMGLSYQAVQSLLARARRTLRAALAGTLAVSLWLWRGRPRTAGGGAQTAALVSTAVTLVIAGLGLTAPSEAELEEAPAPRLRPYATPLAADSGSVSKGRRTPEPSKPVPAAAPGDGLVPSTDQGAGDPLTGAGPALSSPPSAAPSDPPGTPLPDLPALPDAPEPALPTAPDVSTVVLPVAPTMPPGPVAPALADATDGPLTTGTVPLPRR